MNGRPAGSGSRPIPVEEAEAHLLRLFELAPPVGIVSVDDYTTAVRNLSRIRGFDHKVVEDLAHLPGFRNVEMHEYVGLDYELTNARLEAMNNKIRLLSHRAFAFQASSPLIATIYVWCSGIRLPQLQLV